VRMRDAAEIARQHDAAKTAVRVFGFRHTAIVRLCPGRA
jgi:hypothetical protein